MDTPSNELPGLFEPVSDEAYLIAGSRVTHRCECPLSPQLVIRSTICLLGVRIFGVGGSNGATSG